MNIKYLMQKTLRSFYARFLSTENYLRWEYKRRTGRVLSLENPMRFTEKLQWLKLNDIHPEYTTMVDKIDAKEYVSNLIGDEYIVPTIGVWNSVDEIDWQSLPERFVIKVTSDSGGVVVCKNRSELDIEFAKAKLKNGWGRNYYAFKKEYPYRDVKPRIIAEEYLDNGKDSDLPDYKFFCFNGTPMFCQVIRDRHTKETIDFYDMNWSHQEFVGLNPFVRNGETSVSCPDKFEEMKRICHTLSAGIPFVRVDLYVVGDKIYFGELTFFPASGMGTFTPDEWDFKLGELLVLPKSK